MHAYMCVYVYVIHVHLCMPACVFGCICMFVQCIYMYMNVYHRCLCASVKEGQKGHYIPGNASYR